MSAEPRSRTRMLAHTDPLWASDRIIELEAERDELAREVERLRELTRGDDDFIVVRVRRIDAHALVLGGLEYAVAVGKGQLPPGASPMRLRTALRDALNPRTTPVAPQTGPQREAPSTNPPRGICGGSCKGDQQGRCTCERERPITGSMETK